MTPPVTLPDAGVLAALPSDPATRELRTAAAVLWYAHRLVSQGRAAEIAGLPRVEFLRALARYGVSPSQETADDIEAAYRRG